MNDWSCVNDVLEYAIDREQEAADFYAEVADKATYNHMKEVFEGFAKEEMGHKARLLAIQQKEMLVAAPTKSIADLKVDEYLVVEDPSADMDFQDALILAMKKEKAAFRLYSDLADLSEGEAVANVFRKLAQEEAKHKLKFEIEYDDFIMAEN